MDRDILFMEEILPPSCYGKYLNVHMIKDFILYRASYMPGGGGIPWEHPSTVCQYVFIALMFEMKTSMFLFLNVASIGNNSINYGKKATWPEQRIQILVYPSPVKSQFKGHFYGCDSTLWMQKMYAYIWMHTTLHILWNYWIMHSSNIKYIYIFQYIFMHITVLIAMYHAFMLEWVCFFGSQKVETDKHTHIPTEKWDRTVKRQRPSLLQVKQMIESLIVRLKDQALMDVWTSFCGLKNQR